MYLHRSGENDVDFMGNLETEEGELPDDLAGATGIIHKFIFHNSLLTVVIPVV